MLDQSSESHGTQRKHGALASVGLMSLATQQPTNCVQYPLRARHQLAAAHSEEKRHVGRPATSLQAALQHATCGSPLPLIPYSPMLLVFDQIKEILF